MLILKLMLFLLMLLLYLLLISISLEFQQQACRLSRGLQRRCCQQISQLWYIFKTRSAFVIYKSHIICVVVSKKNLCLNIQIFQEELWWDHQVKFPSSLSSTKHILFSFDLVGYVEDDDNDLDYEDYHNEDNDYEDYNDDNGTQGEQEPVRGRSRSRQKPPVG